MLSAKVKEKKSQGKGDWECEVVGWRVGGGNDYCIKIRKKKRGNQPNENL